MAFREKPTQSGAGVPLFQAHRTGDPGDGLFFRTSGRVLALGNSDGVSTLGEFAVHLGQQPFYAYFVFLQGSGNQRLELNQTTITTATSGERFLNGLSVGGSVTGLVSYVENVDSEWLIQVSSALGTVTFVDSAVDEPDTFTRPQQTSVNGFGEVVFTGSLGGDPLLLADGNVLRRVVCRDMFDKFGVFGFTRHDITQRAINNDGQIAFRAETGFIIIETGASEAFVVRADPAQHRPPSSCVDVLDGTPCMDEDSETVAYCVAGECVADPVPEPGTELLAMAALAALLARSRRDRPRT